MKESLQCHLRNLKKILFVFSVALSSQIPAEPWVHVFGDSHANWCFSEMGKPEYIFVYDDLIKIPISINWFASKTIEEVNNRGLDISRVKQNDIAVFVFGEVDVRYNIGRQRDEQKRSLNDVIDALITPYIAFINNCKRLFTIECMIVEVMPPGSFTTFYGTTADRVSITRILNKKLQESCKINNILFLAHHDLHANPDGSMNADLADGVVHLDMKHNLSIRRRLIELLIQKKLLMKDGPQ